MESSHMMRRTESKQFHCSSLTQLAAVAILWVACLPSTSLAQQSGQKTFSSPEDASSALVTAAQNNDEKVLLEILGADGKRIVASGDPAEDAESRSSFAKKYQEMHRLVKEPDGTTVLYIGAENWPTPIPLRHKGHSWYFDTAAGEKEILYRRIGRNETSAIRVCMELVAAEKEYSSTRHEYAQKIFGDDEHKDSLYWKASGTEPQSPIGPLVAAAFTQGNAISPDGAPTPYRGYFYHILTAQGKNATGGAGSYIEEGKMTKGFAFVAYPAEYRSSGVMTFIVSDKGVVYEKDLGKRSSELAKSMNVFNPGPGWKKADVPQQENPASATGSAALPALAPAAGSTKP
jgi:hypothetical protein